MIKRGLALSLVLGLGSVAQGGAVLELRPAASTNPGQASGTHAPGEEVAVDLILKQTAGGADHLLRLLKLHFDDTDPDLSIGALTWSFGAAGHYKDEDNAGGPPGVSVAYVGEGNCSDDFAPCNLADGCAAPAICVPNGVVKLGPLPASMQLIPGNQSEVNLGTILVTMPAVGGLYTLDAMNADDPSPDNQAAFSFGYGCAGACNSLHADSDFPITFWRAAGDLTGGTVEFDVGGVPPCTTTLASANPPSNGSLWRSAKNIMRLTFDADIVAPASGEIEMVACRPGCVEEPVDLSSFTIAVEDAGAGPRVLKIQDDLVSDLDHRTWYKLRSSGWCVQDFSLEYLVQVGDADGNKFVTAGDLSAINANQGGGFQPDDSRFDIDGNRFHLATDLSLANANQSGFVLNTCCP